MQYNHAYKFEIITKLYHTLHVYEQPTECSMVVCVFFFIFTCTYVLLMSYPPIHEYTDLSTFSKSPLIMLFC